VETTTMMNWHHRDFDPAETEKKKEVHQVQQEEMIAMAP
jgi:hypothetical protein